MARRPEGSVGSESGERPSDTLRRLVGGYQVSQAIHVAATLGIADHLAKASATSDELAAATDTHPESLYRLLRALASIGILREEEGRVFTLTPLGDALRSDAPDSLAGWAAFVGRPSHWQAWAALEHSVRTGENAFRKVHGTDVWSYRSDRPEESAIFDRAMESLTRWSHRALIEAYDFARFQTVVDVGGGNGSLLAALLPLYPAMQGVVFDQAHVVSQAEGVLRNAGVDGRCRVVPGDFFQEVPEADAHLLKAILHDWEDEDATTILRNCARAVRPGGAVLVIERLLGPPNEDPASKFSDLNMLIAAGGRERTLDEFGALFRAAGLELAAATPTRAGLSIVEARPPSR